MSSIGGISISALVVGVITPRCGGCPAPPRTVSSIPGRYPLNANGNQIRLRTSPHVPGEPSCPGVETHCSGVAVPPLAAQPNHLRSFKNYTFMPGTLPKTLTSLVKGAAWARGFVTLPSEFYWAALGENYTLTLTGDASGYGVGEEAGAGGLCCAALEKRVSSAS